MEDDFMSLRGESSDDDDLFGAFSSPDPDDPFASLDAAPADDPFASLDAAGDDDPFSTLTLGSEPQPAADDDIFGAFGEPERVDIPESQPDFDESATRPAWLSELDGGFDDDFGAAPVAAPRPGAARAAKGTSSAREGILAQFVGSGPQGMAFGMTAQQRMVLAIFLFLDVAVIGFMILLAIGAIAI